MLRNQLVVLYRNLLRHFSYSFINILGLGIGLSCSLIMFLYVRGEWNYDKGFEQADRICRIGVSFFNMGKFANGPERLLNVLPGGFAGIETATRIKKEVRVPVEGNAKKFPVPVVFFTDTAFFHVFHFDEVAGDFSHILSGPQEAVITKELAQKYFGRDDVLGEVLEVGKEKLRFMISGVVNKPDFHTHLHAELWLSNQSRLKGDSSWTSAAFYNYVLLKPGVRQTDLELALDRVIDTHVYPEAGTKQGFKSLSDYKGNENSVRFIVQPLPDIYLKSKLSLEMSPGGNESSTYIFSAISFFILILAGVNFVNLTTARASRRAKEVGIRKTLGTTRRRLMGQFLLESVLTSSAAMLVALFLSEIFLVLMEQIAGASLVPTVWNNPSSVFLYFAFSVLVGLVSGIYPAFYLTSFLPVKVLKGNITASSGTGFRNFLVVFQFSVSITLIISTTVVLQQLQFIHDKDLGFDQQNVLTIDNSELLGQSAQTFKDELSRASGVVTSSFHGGEPGSHRILTFNTFRTAEMQNDLTVNTYFGDADYVSLMGYRLIKGRLFSKDLASDTAGVILNESAVRALGLGDHPIGAVLNKELHVIGVVSDFHWESLRTSIAPTALILSQAPWELGFRLSGNVAPDFIRNAAARWKQLVPDEPFQYHFLDQNFADLLEKESVFGKALGFFTALAVLISCLGLYGLAAYTAEQRTKEIGIRKVLGASVGNILVLLNKKFTGLVFMAVFIAIPTSSFAVSRWLEGFAYKAPIGVWAYLGSVVAALSIAWITVSFHSVKAALINPAETIQYE